MITMRDDRKGKTQSFQAVLDFEASKPYPGFASFELIAWGATAEEAAEELKKTVALFVADLQKAVETP